MYMSLIVHMDIRHAASRIFSASVCSQHAEIHNYINFHAAVCMFINNQSHACMKGPKRSSSGRGASSLTIGLVKFLEFRWSNCLCGINAEFFLQVNYSCHAQKSMRMRIYFCLCACNYFGGMCRVCLLV